MKALIQPLCLSLLFLCASSLSAEHAAIHVKDSGQVGINREENAIIEEGVDLEIVGRTKVKSILNLEGIETLPAVETSKNGDIVLLTNNNNNDGLYLFLNGQWSKIGSSETEKPTMIPFSQMTLSSSGDYNVATPQKAFEGNGLSDDLHNNTWQDMWLSSKGPNEGKWIKINLGSSTKISSLKIWNYNQLNLANRGLESINIYTSTTNPNNNTQGEYPFNSNGWTLVKENLQLSQGTGAISLDMSDEIDMGNVTAQYLAIKVNSNFSGEQYCGVSEIQVWGTPGKDSNVVMIPKNEISTTTSTQYSNASGMQVVNGAGLSSGTHDANWPNMWLSAAGEPADQWIKIDLGHVSDLHSIKIWNYNQSGISERSIQSATIYSSTVDHALNLFGSGPFNPTGWTSHQTITLAKSNGLPGLSPETFSLEGISARYLSIKVNSHYGAAHGYLGLSEVEVFKFQ